MRIFTLLKKAFTKIKSLSAVVDATDDYVVEQGTSGSWTYRKWNSGVAECWRRISASGQSGGGTLNSWYYRLLSYNFPTGFFKTVPVCNIDAKWGTGVSWANAREVTTTSAGATFISNQASGNMEGSIYAIGKWK